MPDQQPSPLRDLFATLPDLDVSVSVRGGRAAVTGPIHNPVLFLAALGLGLVELAGYWHGQGLEGVLAPWLREVRARQQAQQAPQAPEGG